MRKIGVILLFLIFTLAIPVFSAQEAPATAPKAGFLQSVLSPVQASLAKLGTSLPKLGGLLVILVVGVLITVGIALLLRKFLEIIRLEKGVKKIKVTEILKKGGIGLSLSEVITEIVFFLIIIGTLITALEFYGLSTSSFISQMLTYVPHVIAAVFVLILGILLAILISGIITLVGGNLRIAQSDTLGSIARYAIIIVAGLIALKELGPGAILTDKSKDIIFGGLILGLTLAFGLGTKDKAEKFLNKLFKE